jgi:hypothetical protein
MKAEWIKTDGTVVEVKPSKGKHFNLQELQKFVGGYIELVYLPNNRIMVVNEEGKVDGLPVNERATNMITFDDVIVGDVLVCDSKIIK